MSAEAGSSALPSWDLTRILLAVVALGGLIAASFWVLRPFLLATVWATMIVVATWPTLRAVQARLWGKRGLAVAVMTVTMLMIVVAPVAVGVVTVVEHGEAIVAWSRSLAELSVPGPPAWVRGLPLVRREDRRGVAEDRVGATGGPRRPRHSLSHGHRALDHRPRWGASARSWFRSCSRWRSRRSCTPGARSAAAGVLAFARRLAGEAGERVAVLSAQAIRAVALGIVVTALVQSVIGGIGLAVTGVPYPVLLTAVMFVLGVAQIGPMPVLLGAVIWLYWRDETLWGTVMVVWSLVTVSLDNFLRPLLIKRGADLPLLLIFAGVLGGLLAFGIIGLFIGPVVLAVTYTLLQAWVAEGEAVSERRAPATVTAGRAAVDR